MKKSSVVIAVMVAFAIGFVAGLIWAAYKGPPPGLGPEQRTAARPAQALSETLQSRLAKLEQRVQADPANFETLVEAGNFCFDHDLYDQAARYYQMALKIRPDDPNVLTDLAIVFRRTGHPKKAVSLLGQARKADPLHQNSALNLGIVLLHDLNDKKAALKAWEDYLALNPQGEQATMIRRVVNQLREEL
ncbi:MAG: tetratricopeptide repeat protein [Deltaproteobacteria bacterium]|nr:tetratricopeptide repeat protein [Deltaproteobacteria bacterium]